jgi:hypothetical protein
LIPGVTVVTTLAWHFFRPARLRAHWAPGIPCALCFEGRTILASLAQTTCGEIAELWLFEN